MANIKPPTKKAVKTDMVSLNSTEKPSLASLKLIQIKVSQAEHQEVKIFAAERNMSVKKLFLAMFENYKANGL